MDAFFASVEQRDDPGLRGRHIPATTAAPNQMLRNEFANLPKQVQFRLGYQAFAYAFRPVVWQGCAQPSSFSFRSDGMAVHVYHDSTQRACDELLGPGLIPEWNQSQHQVG
jgi:hypothetical protein